MAKITNRDIAERAGVSPAAVSMAIHGKKGISEATRAHILEIVQSMNYKPPTRARASQMEAVALLISDPAEPLLPFLTNSLVLLSKEGGYELRLIQSEQAVADPASALTGCDLLITFDGLDRATLELFAEQVKQILVIDGNFSRKPFWNIRLDYDGAAYALTRHLAELGHRSFIYLNDDLPASKNLTCFSGFQRLILELHLPLNPAQIIMELGRDPHIWAHVPDIIRNFDISAIICTSDKAAVETVNQLRDYGYRVPEDISVAVIVPGALHNHPGFSFTQVSLQCHTIEQELRRLMTKGTPPDEFVDQLIPYGEICTGTSVTPARFNPATKKIGLTLYLRDHPTLRAVRAGFLEKTQQLGYQATVISTEFDDQSSYEKALASLLEEDVDGVVAWLPAPKIFREFSRRGIPVVLLHSSTRDDVDHGEQARIASNPSYIAKGVSDFLSKRLRDRSGILAVTQSGNNALEASITSELTRFMAESCPRITIRHDFDFVGVKNEYTSLAKEFIETNPETVAVFTTAGYAGVTWCRAKKAAGREDIIVVGTDYSDESIELTETGAMDAFVAQPVYEEGQQGVVAMDAILRGKSFPFFRSLDAPLATKKDLGRYKRLMQDVKNWYL